MFYKLAVLIMSMAYLEASVLRDAEEVPCEEESPADLRNGLGDDSLYIWPDNKIPYIIGQGFNSTQEANILDAIQSYNRIFDNCLKWIERSNEVRFL